MTATASPFGLRPVYHPSGLDRARQYQMSAAYATPIYKNSPVVLTANLINLAAAGADWLGSFAGVTYIDLTGKPVITNFWPGATTGATNIQAWVFDDPQQVYEIQSAGSIATANIGDQTNFDASIGSGSATTGLSIAACTAALAGSGVQGSMRIHDKGQQVDNDWGDAFTIVQVTNARHQFVSNKVAV